MAIIPARIPYKITQNLTSLEVKIKTWAAIEPTEYQHTITKASYTGSAMDLTIDVSPYIKPYFVFTPQPTGTPTAGLYSVAVGEFLNVEISVNGVVETHQAVYGYVEPSDPAYYDHWQVTKAIARNSDSYLTLPAGIYTVYWNTSDGEVAQAETTASGYPNTVAVIHPDLDLTNSHTLTVTAGSYSYNYKIVCPYQDGTIGFINRVGMWEYFDVLGRQDYTISREDNDFRSYKTGEKTTFGVNSERGVRVNTGWEDNEFGRRIMSELMNSENIIWHKGTSWESLTLDTKSIREQYSRTDKMINYTLDFTYSTLQIPII